MAAYYIVFTNKKYLMNTSDLNISTWRLLFQSLSEINAKKGDFRNCVNHSSRIVNGSSSGFREQHALACRCQPLFALVLTGLVWIVLMAKILMTPMVLEMTGYACSQFDANRAIAIILTLPTVRVLHGVMVLMTMLQRDWE